ncbi:hypothetical protein [Microcoleus sp. FACHB-68]|nr:hypothetical protein [Microcoleus sp. FACHB-68]MBD1940228.1 hypothetical protein [Microcoleus sp. FACHB-68]
MITYASFMLCWGIGHGAWGMGDWARLRQPKGMGMGLRTQDSGLKIK